MPGAPCTSSCSRKPPLTRRAPFRGQPDRPGRLFRHSAWKLSPPLAGRRDPLPSRALASRPRRCRLEGLRRRAPGSPPRVTARTARYRSGPEADTAHPAGVRAFRARHRQWPSIFARARSSPCALQSIDRGGRQRLSPGRSRMRSVRAVVLVVARSSPWSVGVAVLCRATCRLLPRRTPRTEPLRSEPSSATIAAIHVRDSTR